MQTKVDCEVNVNILNSLVYLYSCALRPEELEAKVLPQYAKHRIEHDVCTYAHLTKMYLNLRDLDKVVDLYR